jgi:DNA topoisomerase III
MFSNTEIAGEKFNYKGKGSLIDGFTAVMPWMRIPAEKSASDMKQGQQYPVMEVTLIEGKTSPPDFLSEWELIGLMEKNGIGTDASIPVHIENICTRNYVQVDSHSRTLKPTNLGIALVHGYTRIDPELYLPKCAIPNLDA